MHLSLFLTVWAILGEPGPLTIAVGGLSVSGIPVDRVTAYTEHLGAQLAACGAVVTTPAEVGAILGFERQKQLLGCTDGSNCVAEFAGALGAESLLAGTVTQVEGRYLMSLKLLRVSDGQLLAGASARVESEGKLFDALAEAARVIMGEVSRVTGRRAVIPVHGPPLRAWSWLPALGAIAGGGLGAVFLNSSNRSARTLSTSPSLLLSEARQLRADGQRDQTLGAAMIGVGSACLVAGGILFFYRGPSTAVELIPFAGSTGAGVSVRGRF